MDQSTNHERNRSLDYELNEILLDGTEHANQEIDSIRSQFRAKHVKAHLIITLIAFCFENSYYFLQTDRINTGYWEFVFRYAFVPTISNLVLFFVAFLTIRSGLQSRNKNYVVMFCSLLQCQVFVICHQIFSTINAAFIILVFISTVYHEKVLTRLISLSSLCGIVIAVFLVKYDSDHIVTSQYVSDFLVIIFILFISHITSEFIITNNKLTLSKILNAMEEKGRYCHGMMIDNLSGLYSRAAFRSFADKLEEQEHEISFVMLDLDNFKMINDSHGHLYGDEVIRILGATLQSFKSASFLSFRYGGEEFLCVLKSDPEASLHLMQEVKAKFQSACREALGQEQISFSAGVTRFSGKKPLSDVIKEADSALYQAKEEGKDRVLIYRQD